MAALAAGALSIVSVQPQSDALLSAVATGGTAPYTYQWYKSYTSGFSPGGGNIISGATALSLTETGLVPGTKVYYKVVATDSALSPATATSSQLEVDLPALQPNISSFAQTKVLGMQDLPLNYNSVAAIFDPSASGVLVAGQVLKWVTTAGSPPRVAASAATSDKIAGVVNYNIKNASFAPGQALEMSRSGNVIWMTAGLAINRGVQVTSLPAGVAGGGNGVVIPAVGSGGLPILGEALDTVAVGELVRVQLAFDPQTLS